jgi:nucleotide-binding universal stress UspA family protein
MKKILVPIDFNQHSVAGFLYANNLAYEMDAEVTILNVVNGSFNTGETLSLEPLKQVEEAMMERLNHFSTSHLEEEGIQIKDVPLVKEVRFGIPGFSIADMANEEGFDLIVMGTRDKHGIFDKIFGSTSSVVIASAKVPVVIIHEHTLYKEIDKIILGFDQKNGLEDALKFLQEFNKNRKAEIEFVHVLKNEGDQIKDSVDEIIDEMVEDYIDFPFTIKNIRGKEVEETLVDYSINAEADILVVYHRNKGLLERVFRKSSSVEIAQKLPLPVYIIPAQSDD